MECRTLKSWRLSKGSSSTAAKLAESASKRGTCSSRGTARPLRLFLERQFEPERTAETDRALQSDAAAHQFDKLLSDRGAKAGAAEAACRGLISLGEAIEDMFLRVGGDADPRIAYGNL